MFIFIFIQCCKHQVLDGHTKLLSVSLDLITFAFWNIEADIVIILFEVFRCRLGFLTFSSGYTLLAVFLRAGGYGKDLTALRTYLFAANSNGRAGLLLFCIGSIPLDLSLITAVYTILSTAGRSLKLHTAHLTFASKQAYSPLEQYFPLFYHSLGIKSSIT